MTNIILCVVIGAVVGFTFNLYFYLEKLEKTDVRCNICNNRYKVKKRDIFKLFFFAFPAGFSGLGMVFFVKWYFDIIVLSSEICYLIVGVTGIFWELIHQVISQKMIPHIIRKLKDKGK